MVRGFFNFLLLHLPHFLSVHLLYCIPYLWTSTMLVCYVAFDVKSSTGQATWWYFFLITTGFPTMKFHTSFSCTPAFFNVLSGHLVFSLPSKITFKSNYFNNLDLLALLMFLYSVSGLAKVIYIFLSPNWKVEVLLIGKESLLGYNYGVYVPSALSSMYLSSLSILSSLTLNF